MSWRCLFGHDLRSIAPLYTRCCRCGQAFFTEYFASREAGYTIRVRVSEAEAARAALAKAAV